MIKDRVVTSQGGFCVVIAVNFARDENLMLAVLGAQESHALALPDGRRLATARVHDVG